MKKLKHCEMLAKYSECCKQNKLGTPKWKKKGHNIFIFGYTKQEVVYSCIN